MTIIDTGKATPIRSGRKSYPVHGLKDLSGIDGNAPGTFEAIVAVFGNVDYGNDRIVAGAFGKSLVEWEGAGDPIPVIFSHQWDNLDAHIGEVIEAKELLPGDDLLPTELRANGGLWVKFVVDLSEDFASRVAKRLTKRTLKEFSFAYDVPPGGERRASDGVNELTELSIIEVGPTLKGMNPATVLLARARKALGDAGAELTDEQILDRLTVTVADDADPDGAKAWVTLTGSSEERQEAAYAAAFEWASSANIGNGGFYSAYLEATFDDRVVILVEGWDDPYGEGIYYELDLSLDGDTATVDNPREVALSTTTVAKSRGMKHRLHPGSAPAVKSRGTVSIDDETGKGKGKGSTPEDPAPRTGSDDGTASGIPASEALDLALLEAGLDPTDSTP